MNKLTLDEYEKLNADLVVDDSENTNKKCPICGAPIVIEEAGSSYALKCQTVDCILLEHRGI